MDKVTVFDSFLQKLRREKSEAEVKNFIAHLGEFSTAELFSTMLEVLTDEDVAAIEVIPDEREAEGEVVRRFEIRTGMTPREFVEKLKEAVAREYPKT